MTPSGNNDGYTPAYKPAAISAVLVFALYLLTLSPTVAMWDTGEYMAAVKVLGIPHPPGNPFFMLLGHAFASIPIPVSYAARVNILAALASACSAGLWFLITDRIVSRWIVDRLQRIVAAATATLIGATAFTVWNQSVVNEKVYTVSLLFLTIVSWLVLRWIDNHSSPRADRYLILAAFLIGLGYSNHPAGFLAIPAAGMAIVMTRWRTLLRWRLLLAALGALIVGLTPFAYEPIRAAYFPPMNEGAPTACETKLAAACTFSKVTKDRLLYVINREQYPPKIGRQAPATAQVGMWWLYFKWQWLRDAHETMPAVQAVVAFVFLMLGLLGGYVHWTRDRRSFWYFAPLMMTITLALIYYLNFKYGWSQNPELGDSVDREVRDRDYFYIWSFSAWGVWTSIGLTFVWQRLASTRRGLVLAMPVLLIALIPLIGNWHSASRAGSYFTQQWAHDYLNSLEPYAIVVTNGDNDSFPLWYAQEVEGVRRDVTVAVSTYLGTDWYARQLIRQPVATYDETKGPAIFRGQTWKKPSGPPLKMSFAEADSIPDYIEVRQPAIFRKGKVELHIPPSYVLRNQLVLLRLIRDSFPERPIYVGMAGMRGLGLEPYLLTQGFAQKLVDHPLTDTPATPQIGAMFVDVERMRTLWKTVYRAPDSLKKEGDWIDRASLTIPYTYAYVGSVLSQALARRGENSDARAVMDDVREIVKTARIGLPGS